VPGEYDIREFCTPLAAKIAAITGESKTRAVKTTLRERKERLGLRAVRRPLVASCMIGGTAQTRSTRNAGRGLLGALLLLTVVLVSGPDAVGQPQTAGPVLTVRETAGVARNSEIVRSGVPLPRSLNLLNTSALTVVDSTNTPVPAEFQVLARWNAGRQDPSAPVQWLLVTFPATVAAHGSATHRIVTDGSVGPNPPPSVAVSLTQNGNQITVNTGAATFTLGGDSGALFDEIRQANGTRLVSGGTLTAFVNGADANHPATRRIAIEHAGPLSAIVVVEGAYDMAPVGGGGLSSLRRYVFTAGSPTATVRHVVKWEGDRCGSAGALACGGSPNAVRIERARDALTLDMAGPLSVTAVGSFPAAAVQGTASAGQTAWVRQQLRANRAAPVAFDINVPGTSGTTGRKAEGAMLAISNASGTVAVALDHMHRYEPQALRLLADGRLAVDIADDHVWLGARQGLFATIAVSALPDHPPRADLDRLVWAPLNHPLRAWPTPDWFAASDAVEELPVGPLPARLASFDTHVPSVLTLTLQNVDDKGLAGLMTFGLYPRFWGNNLYDDELDCGGNDPTPAEAWDNTYWCATWTDYHNTVAAAPVWAMRSGDVGLLDEIAFPGALRSLHTQVLQCGPDDGDFYCGQAPAGYGGYRADFNSSHAYFENLFLYYWLTGDSTVVQTLERGARSMRNYLCARRPSSPCLPDDPPSDYWAQLTGRVAMQWFAVFRFVGLASDDASYLGDYRSGLARAVTQHYVEPAQGGTRYGFWLPGGTPVTGPGTYTTDQLWIASLYDMNMLYRLQGDTHDAPIGNPGIPPSQVLAAWGRTLVRFGATVSGDGTATGRWPNQLDFTWSGGRIGGTLTSVGANTSGSDPYLYDTGKATLTAGLVRAGQHANDIVLTQMGADLTQLALASAQGSDVGPLGKIQGEYLARLPAAVARLSATSIAAGVLTIASVNPNSGVGITVSPLDTGGLGNGMTPFSRAYNLNTLVNVTASATAGPHTFQKWQRDGTDFSTSASAQVTVDADHTLTAVYALASFVDVPPSHMFWPWIEALVRAGITGGCGTNPPVFCPDQTVTRAQMAVFLLRGIHGAGYAPPAAAGIFTDVPLNDPFAAWIDRLSAEGITAGCGTTPLRYCPAQGVTRGQMAVFLLRSKHGAGYQPPAAAGIFTDVPLNDPSAPWVEQLFREGITGGCGTNPALYCPEQAVTRGQMAVFLARTFGLPLCAEMVPTPGSTACT
jgi:hypothetical protein